MSDIKIECKKYFVNVKHFNNHKSLIFLFKGNPHSKP